MGFYEWRRTDIKYSILKELWVKVYADWKFKIMDPDTASGDETQFYMSYPNGRFTRPSLACESNGMQAGSRASQLALRSETMQFSVIVFGASWSEVERITQQVRDKLDSVRVGMWHWNEKTKVFDASLIETFLIVYESDTLRTQVRRNPEARIVFRV